MISSRHLPPQFRRRPARGLLVDAHANDETVKAGTRASAWRRANDPDVALGRRLLGTTAAAGSVLSPAAATPDVARRPAGATPSGATR